MTVTKIPMEEFVRVWQDSKSAQEAADRLGIQRHVASSRASYYRHALKLELQYFKAHRIEPRELVRLRQLVKDLPPKAPPPEEPPPKFSGPF